MSRTRREQFELAYTAQLEGLSSHCQVLFHDGVGTGERRVQGAYSIVAMQMRGCAFQATATTIVKEHFAPARKLGALHKPSALHPLVARILDTQLEPVAEPIKRDRAHPRVPPLQRSSTKARPHGDHTPDDLLKGPQQKGPNWAETGGNFDLIKQSVPVLS